MSLLPSSRVPAAPTCGSCYTRMHPVKVPALSLREAVTRFFKGQILFTCDCQELQRRITASVPISLPNAVPEEDPNFVEAMHELQVHELEETVRRLRQEN